ncbi:phytanoyl-CoA dioxygenase family protein [Streptomyces sp. NBC_00247]|uniref:phytanoyl-CoA dioxygenase family protein n=1 Tax=Streptomyces sp. NBC_00247 TaxID=2975689 RepID=UPI002E2D7770|nr:phytanoyl-CoA dioxygenase family protein [Streptomyces sp. NBC_00247]
MSSTDITSALAEIATSGYVILPGALDKESTTEISAALRRMLREDDETWGADRLVEIRERGALRNLAADGAFGQLLETSPALDIVDKLLGPRAILNCFDALTLFPGQGRYPWDYHTDLMDVTGVDFPAHKIPGVNVLYYVDQVREKNGSTWVVPGSHLSLVEEPDPDTMAPASVPLEVEPGDAVVFDARIWHCAGTNNSDDQRTLIKTLFTSHWYRPQMDFTRAVPASVLSGLDKRAQRYLGVENVPPTTVEELRMRLFHGGVVPSDSPAEG